MHSVLKNFRGGLFLALIFLCGPVFAQGWGAPGHVLMQGYSESEKIGFAFYHFTRREPPFQAWLDADESLQKLSPSARYYKRYEEGQRLKAGFLSFAPYRDTIRVYTKIRLREVALAEPGKKAIGINFRSTDEAIYFPYEIGPLWIAVQPLGLGREVVHPVSDAEYDRLRLIFGAAALEGFEDITAELVVLALAADPLTPIEVGDQPLWPMAVELQALHLLDGEGGTAWSARNVADLLQ